VTRARLREWLVVLAAVAATTIVCAWPVILRPWSIPEHQDPLFSTWRLYQWSRNVFERPTALFEGNIFHPEPDVLLYSDAVALLGLAGAPFIRAGVPPLLVYDALVVLSFLTAGLAMYLFARDLTGSREGALVAAVIFTGAPYRAEHVYHLELLWTCWIPLALWAVQRMLMGTGRSARLLAFALTAQFLCSIYYGLFLITVLPIVSCLAWAMRPATIPLRTLGRLAVALALAAAVVAVYSWPYARVRQIVGARPVDEVRGYGAEPVNYVATPAGNVVWGWTADVLGTRERRLSAGVLAYALAAPALLPPLQPWAVGLFAGAVVAFDASRGLDGHVYPVLHRLVPPYRGLRVPARFAAIVLAMVAALAAIGVARVQRDVGNPRWWKLVTAALVAGLMMEYTTTVATRELPSRVPSLYAWLGEQPRTVIAHFPMPQLSALPGRDADFQYFAQYHRHQLVNGCSGFYPRSYLQFLDRVEGFPDERAIRALRNAGVTLVILHVSHYDPRDLDRVNLAIERNTELESLGPFGDGVGAARVYRLR
jgi:hypothetical protein